MDFMIALQRSDRKLLNTKRVTSSAKKVKVTVTPADGLFS